MEQGLYTSGQYLANNPDWHQGDARWKADNVARLIERHVGTPSDICEVGCGAGEILRVLADRYPGCSCAGFDISPQALQLARQKSGPRLQFTLGQAWDTPRHYHVALAADVMEHVENYHDFLRHMHGLADFKIYNIPLDISCQTVLRGAPLLRNWQRIGHIHLFTKDLALAALKDTGHEVLEWFYASGVPSASARSRLLTLPRRALFALSPDVAVRLLGGYSLMVICR